jgi:RNA recognition motif-containing protein
MPRLNPLHGMSHEHPFEGPGGGGGPGPGGGEEFRPHPPFEESSTLKCTGIPRYVKEAELYAHFIKFGRVVKLALKRFGGPDDPTGMDQKTYNECLLQFEDASDCRKCLSSPLSVLNNRFIKIFSAPHNIVSSAELADIDEPYPGAKQDEENGLWAGTGGSGHSGRGRGGRMPGRGRGRWSFGGGRDFSGEEQHFARKVDPLHAALASAAQEQASSANPSEDSVGVGDFSGSRTNEARARPDPTDNAAPTAAQLEKERLRGMVQQKYDDLKSLRHRAEGIWRQKEDLLQVSAVPPPDRQT